MTEHDSLLVVFPGALGDFLCVLPTVLALRMRHPGVFRFAARPAWLDLVEVPGLVPISIDRREVADLFASAAPLQAATRALFGGVATAYSWTGFGDAAFAARLADATGGRVYVFPFRALRPAEHAVDYYARCVEVAPLPVPPPLFREDDAWLAEHSGWRRPLLVVHPGSGSARKNWQGFPEVIVAWRALTGGTAVVLRGPVENESAVAGDLDVPVVRDRSLPQVVALLRRAGVYVGNDSGISHLTAALGTRTVALFGDSDPAAWAPRGARVRVLHAPEACAQCGPEVFCVHRLPAERVFAAVESTP